jgi:trehalose 6-phosphate synthase/phosphatase
MNLFQTDEDMYRALIQFQNGTTRIMDPPFSANLIDKKPTEIPVQLAIQPQAVFTTTVGHSTKRTLAAWHVSAPAEVVEHILCLVRE